MIKLYFKLLAFAAIAFVLQIQPGSAKTKGTQSTGIAQIDNHEFSSSHRGKRYKRVARMHYYDPYPWWWHQPHVARARTNYLGWPHSNYPVNYERPFFDGVVGYPGGYGWFGTSGLYYGS